MAESICLYLKDGSAIVIKQPKRSPLFVRMIVLVFAMVCGLYICSVCLKQFSVGTSQTCSNSHHYSDSLPKPHTFNSTLLLAKPTCFICDGIIGAGISLRSMRHCLELQALLTSNCIPQN
ncbi:Sulfotransferase [Raphanus sativus]|nr:Sulfotransferase [Raphanus sativus]